jgi:hypothetical protein
VGSKHYTGITAWIKCGNHITVNVSAQLVSIVLHLLANDLLYTLLKAGWAWRRDHAVQICQA